MPVVPPAPPPASGDITARLQRSRTMAAIPSSRTSLEQRLAAAMWAAGLRGWRRTKRVEGTRPDFVFTRPGVAVFVDGCFWHGCPECGRRPATNSAYWTAKLDRNVARDREQTQRLEDAGWEVIRLWGHEVTRDPHACAGAVVARVMNGLRAGAARSPNPRRAVTGGRS
jgi:DNA mismatch endonuclease Vsr